MPAFPEMPPQLRKDFPVWYYNWWQAFRTYMLKTLFTDEDVTVNTKGKGLVLTNKAGTIKKRVYLNDAGTGISVEDV